MRTITINGKFAGTMTSRAYNLLPKAFRYRHSPQQSDKLPAGFAGWVVGNRRGERIIIEIL